MRALLSWLTLLIIFMPIYFMTLYHKSLSFHQLPPTIENEQLERKYSYVSQSVGILEKPGHVDETAVRSSRKKETTFISPNNHYDATQSAVTLGLEEENLHVPKYKTESKANNFSNSVLSVAIASHFQEKVAS